MVNHILMSSDCIMDRMLAIFFNDNFHLYAIAFITDNTNLTVAIIMLYL